MPPPAIMAMEATAPTTLANAAGQACRAAEDRLRHARNEEHVDDEGDEDHVQGMRLASHISIE